MTTLPSNKWPASLQVLGSSGSGIISPEIILSITQDLHQRSIFLCGPDSFVTDVKAGLNVLNFDVENLHFESFAGLNNTPYDPGAASVAETPRGRILSSAVAQEIPEELQCEIEFKRSGVTVICQQGDNLLEVANLYGVDIPNSCRMGSCGSCKCIKISGDISLHNTNGLSEADKQTKHVLLCVGSANSRKIVLDA
jgi:ferredoxin